MFDSALCNDADMTDEDLKAELERLKAENEQLKSQSGRSVVAASRIRWRKELRRMKLPTER